MKDNSIELITTENLIIFLKVELKKAEQWLSRFRGEQFNPVDLATNNSLAIAKLESYLAESQTICVNLKEYIEPLRQSIVSYCLCRLHYHGDMVGCDSCDEWYHLHCININVSQLGKLTQYCCIKCMLLKSYQATAVNVALLVNKWMDYGAVVRSRDLKKQKARIIRVCY